MQMQMTLLLVMVLMYVQLIAESVLFVMIAPFSPPEIIVLLLEVNVNSLLLILCYYYK